MPESHLNKRSTAPWLIDMVSLLLLMTVEAMNTAGAVLGVNLAAGVAYLGLVDSAGVPLADACQKVVPPTNVDEWARLRGFGQSLAEEVRAHNVVAVVFAETKKYQQWAYREAHARATLYAAAGLALREVRVEEIPQATSWAALGFSNCEERDKGLASMLSVRAKDVVHWRDRLPAFAAALAASRGRRS
jgi:hypothetical protein